MKHVIVNSSSSNNIFFKHLSSLHTTIPFKLKVNKYNSSITKTRYTSNKKNWYRYKILRKFNVNFYKIHSRKSGFIFFIIIFGHNNEFIKCQTREWPKHVLLLNTPITENKATCSSLKMLVNGCHVSHHLLPIGSFQLNHIVYILKV